MMNKTIQSILLPQKKYSTKPNRQYFKTLNQAGCECFEKATSASRFKDLETLILINYFNLSNLA